VRLVVLQSNYLPWKGYFDLMSKADLFVVYDSVQFTKNDWRNRNRLPSSSGGVWLTVPVTTSGLFGQSIDEVRVVDRRWPLKHERTIRQLLSKAPFFSLIDRDLASAFEAVATFDRLHDVNVLLLRTVATWLGVTTPIAIDRDLGTFDGTPTERLVAMATHVGATSYLTGPAGLDYLERDRFADAGVALEVIDYGAYPQYEQRVTPFDHAVSALDLVANVGPDACTHLVGSVSPVSEVL
jgi:hypothetical protein